MGSSNIDPLSLLLAREANVVVTDVAFAKVLRHELEQAIDHHARGLDLKQYANRSVGQKLLDFAALWFMRVLLLLNGKRY